MLFAAAFVIVYVVAVLTPWGQSMDAASLAAFPSLRDGLWLRVVDARNLFAVLLLLLAVVATVDAMIGRRWAAIGTSAVALGTSVALGVALEYILPRPFFGQFAYAHNTFPSAHVAVGAVAMVAVVWMRTRWNSGLLSSALSVLVWITAGIAFLSFAHRASDAVGGILLVGAVSSAVRGMTAEAGGLPRRGRSWVAAAVASCVASAALVFVSASFAAPVRNDLIGSAALLASAGFIALLPIWLPAEADAGKH